MTTFDGNIAVNVSLDGPPVTEQNFSTVLIAGTSMTGGFTERIRRYANVTESNADADLSAALKARLVVAFSQDLVPSEVAVGRVDGATSDDWNVNTLAVGTIGDTITVTILGEDFVFTSTTGAETASAIVDALIALIGASSQPVTTVDNGNDFDIVGDNAGQPLGVTVAVTGTATAAATNTTPAVTIGDELAAVLAVDSDWYPIALESRDAWDIETSAAFAESNGKLLIAQTSDADCLTTATTDIGTTLKDLSYSKSSVWYKSDDAEYLDVALACDRSVVDPDESSTTYAYVTLVGVTPDDDNITATQKANLLGKNINCYLTLKGVGATGNGKVASGEWIDVIIAADWIKARLEEDAATLLLAYSNRGEKVPYTDQGINAFASLIETRLDQGSTVGHFVDGTAEVNPPLLSSISSATRAARQLTIPWSVEPAGAIHFPTFNGYISLTA